MCFFFFFFGFLKDEGEILNLEDEENHVEVEEEEEEVKAEPHSPTVTPEMNEKQNKMEDVLVDQIKDIVGSGEKNVSGKENKDTAIISITTNNDDSKNSKNSSNVTTPILTSPVEKQPPLLLQQELSIKKEDDIDKTDPQQPMIKTPPPETPIVDNDGDIRPNQDITTSKKESKVESKTDLNSIVTDNGETIRPLNKCDCVKQRPLIDQITITDVTEGDITITIKECFTDAGFFFPRATRQ